MIGSRSPGQFVNWYSNRNSSPHTIYHSRGLIASDTNLIPFSFSFPDNAGTGFTWQLLPIGNGSVINMNSSDLTTHTGNGLRWCSYFGGSLANPVPCAIYEMKVTFGGVSYYSDPIHVRETEMGYVRAGLTTDTAGFSFDVVPNDVFTGTISNQTFQSSTDNATWSNVAGSFSLAGVTTNVWFRRTITTEAGASTCLYQWDGATLIELSEPTPANGLYYLEIGSDQPHNGIIYHRGYKKRIYFEASLSPIFEDEPETIQNGNGETFTTYAQVSDALVITALTIPDAALGGFYEGKYHEATVGRIGGSTMTTQGFDIAVQPVGDVNNVQLTFQRAIYITRACEDALNVTP